MPAPISSEMRRGDRAGLGGLVGVFGVGHLGTVGKGRGQPQPEPTQLAAGSGDDLVGDADHLRGRAVVAFELDHRGVRIAPVEAEQVLRGRSGEGVDRLIGVADHRHLVAAAQPGIQGALLQRCHVLVFIDHEAAVLGPERAGAIVVVLQDSADVQQQIVEVQLLCLDLRRLVVGVDLRHLHGGHRGVPPGLADRARGSPPGRPGRPWPIRSRRPGPAAWRSRCRCPPAGMRWRPIGACAPAPATALRRLPVARRSAIGAARRSGTSWPARRARPVHGAAVASRRPPGW